MRCSSSARRASSDAVFAFWLSDLVGRTKLGKMSLRMLLTMCYVTSGRLLLGTPFQHMTPEIVSALTRVFPFHSAPQSARPVDAFVHAGPFPQIYDFAVSPDWHQVTLLNTFGNIPVGLVESGGHLDFINKRRWRCLQQAVCHQCGSNPDPPGRPVQDILDDIGTGICVNPDSHFYRFMAPWQRSR